MKTPSGDVDEEEKVAQDGILLAKMSKFFFLFKKIFLYIFCFINFEEIRKKTWEKFNKLQFSFPFFPSAKEFYCDFGLGELNFLIGNWITMDFYSFCFVIEKVL
jgi:hypothetical protein